jgi:hypothetical protein
MSNQRGLRERAPARSNGTSAPDSPSDVAELAARLGERLPELVSAISASLRDDIPELRDEAQLPLLEVAQMNVPRRGEQSVLFRGKRATGQSATIAKS